MDKTPAPPLPLPEKFVDFLNENGLDSSIYTASDSVPRYIRVKPGCDEALCLEELEAEIGYKPQKVDWLPGFYSLPNQVQIASTRLYKQGHLFNVNGKWSGGVYKYLQIYGIDAASGAAVSALGISVGDHVLDLCAAPGAKLCLILDILGDSGSATAVDVSSHRLAACRTLVQKYSLGDRCRLFVADGTTFSLGPTKIHKDKSYTVDEEDKQEDSRVFGEWKSRRPWKERRKQRQIRASGAAEHPQLIFYGKKSGVIGLTEPELYRNMSGGYDKVLVDAECTHDGSIRHIQKFEQWGWETLQQRVLNADRTYDNLMLLQLKLLSNGFSQLKVDGRLVYSTCSLTVAQNEDVVQQFLDQNPSAVLEEIEEAGAKSWPYRSGSIPKTLRFDPSTSQTSGLFVARFTKSASL